MKPVSEWDESYLLNLPIGEFTDFEVKGRRALDLSLDAVKEKDVRENLARQVSAFANSGGGRLIFGLKNPEAGQSQWLVDDGGIEVKSSKGAVREWLEDVIPHLVEYPLRNFNVFAIGPGEARQILTNRAVFVIDLPDSGDAPHMSTVDSKYYARIGGKSHAIGHRLVTDIANRRKHPRLELEFWMERALGFKNALAFGEKVWKATLHARCRNLGPILAQYVAVEVNYPLRVLEQERRERRHSGRELRETARVSDQNTKRDVVGHNGISKQYGPSWYSPILPGRSHVWEMLDLDDNVACDPLEIDILQWRLFADNAPPISGSLCLKDLVLRQL